MVEKRGGSTSSPTGCASRLRCSTSRVRCSITKTAACSRRGRSEFRDEPLHLLPVHRGRRRRRRRQRHRVQPPHPLHARRQQCRDSSVADDPDRQHLDHRLPEVAVALDRHAALGADGSLLVSCGDGALFTQTDAGGNYPGLFGSGKTDPYEDIGAFRAQSLSSLAGKILRINSADGTGYPSNPFWDGNATSKRSRIWCYGMRTPFRFNVRPAPATRARPRGSRHALHRRRRARHLGRGRRRADRRHQLRLAVLRRRYAESAYQSANPAHNGCGSFGTADNPAQPTLPSMSWHHSNPDLGSPAGYSGNASVGGAFYTGSQYPAAYHGRYFYADYGQNWIRRHVRRQRPARVAAGLRDEPRSTRRRRTDPITGDLFYVSITAGEVRRIRYTAVGGNGVDRRREREQMGPCRSTSSSQPGHDRPRRRRGDHQLGIRRRPADESEPGAHLHHFGPLLRGAHGERQQGRRRDTVVYASTPGSFPPRPCSTTSTARTAPVGAVGRAARGPPVATTSSCRRAAPPRRSGAGRCSGPRRRHTSRSTASPRPDRARSDAQDPGADVDTGHIEAL